MPIQAIRLSDKCQALRPSELPDKQVDVLRYNHGNTMHGAQVTHNRLPADPAENKFLKQAALE